jgi:hypothetical protein
MAVQRPIPYLYAPLGPDEFRVLELQPSHSSQTNLAGYLVHRPFPIPDDKDNISYEALSYEWGDQTAREVIYIVGETGTAAADTSSISIGRNLAAALRELRHPHKLRTIWCDSVCINQGDLDERAAQVRRMDDVFRCAEGVIAWIGVEADNSTKALDALMRNAGEFRFVDGQLKLVSQDFDRAYFDRDMLWPYSEEEWTAIRRLLLRPWIKRLWIWPEVTLSSNVTLACGSTRVSWPNLGTGIYSVFEKSHFGDLFTDRENNHLHDWINLNWRLRTMPRRGMIELLEFTRTCECQDPRDRVYALLSMLKPPVKDKIWPDYTKRPKDVYKDLVEHWIKTYNNLNFLPFCESPEQPTWVPDLQHYRTPLSPPPAYLTMPPFVWQLQDGQATVRIAGIACGTIREEFPRPPRPEASRWEYTGGRDVFLHLSAAYLRGENEALSQRAEKFARTLLKYAMLASLDDPNPSYTADDVRKVFEQWWTSRHSPALILGQLESQIATDIAYEARANSFYVDDGDSPISGPPSAQQGDEVWVVIGCQSPLLLRPTSGGYQLVGPCYHPMFGLREAILGPIPPGWTVETEFTPHGDRFWFRNDSEQISTRADPRLGELPLGWAPGEEQDGTLFFTGPSGDITLFDPRMSVDALRRRGVAVRDIILL